MYFQELKIKSVRELVVFTYFVVSIKTLTNSKIISVTHFRELVAASRKLPETLKMVLEAACGLE